MADYANLLAIERAGSLNPAQRTELEQLRASGAVPGSSGAGFDIPNYQKYYDKAYKDLESYYARILAEEGGDVDRAKRRIDEDYARGNRTTLEDYTRELKTAEETAGASTRELGFQTQNEQRAIQGDLLRRGVSEGGVAEQIQGRQKTSEQLRQEAIDRALSKNQENLKYAKERSLEQNTIAQKRGTEDVASAFRKFVTEKGQERQDRAAQLGESAYSRDFAERQARASFDLQNRSLDLQRGQ